MSTILKSLKKLEQEKEATRYPVHAGPGTVAASGGSSRWTKVTWIRRSIVVILILGLGATSFYFYRQTKNQSPDAAIPSETTQPTVDKVAKGTVQKRVVQRQPKANPVSTAKPQEAPAQKIRNQASRPPAVPTPKPNTAGRQKELTQPTVVPNQRPSESDEATPIRKPAVAPAQKPSPPAKLPTRRQQVAPTQERKPIPFIRPEAQPSTAKVQDSGSNTPQKRTQPKDAYDSVRPLTDGRLKIHAIVWSETKEDRMAVINTQILHEGDTLSGFSIVAIRPDDVVVRGEGGGLFKVIFGRP